METQLTIFIAFVFAAILMNALLTLGLYLALKKSSTRLAALQRELRSALETARSILEEAEAGSATLGEWTARTRAALPEAEQKLDRLHDLARHGLARMDFDAEEAAGKLGVRILRVAAGASSSVYRATALSLGAQVLLELWLRWRRNRPEKVGPRSAA